MIEQTHAGKIMAQLRRGACRFSALARDVGLADNHNVLSATLKVLTEAGMVTRTVHRIEPPAHIEYSLAAQTSEKSALVRAIRGEP
jgi:DNA-binding HxlR family transcriptional regulator